MVSSRCLDNSGERGDIYNLGYAVFVITQLHGYPLENRHH